MGRSAVLRVMGPAVMVMRVAAMAVAVRIIGRCFLVVGRLVVVVVSHLGAGWCEGGAGRLGGLYARETR